MPANALPCLMILVGFGLVFKVADFIIFFFMHTVKSHVLDRWEGMLFVTMYIFYTMTLIV